LAGFNYVQAVGQGGVATLHGQKRWLLDSGWFSVHQKEDNVIALQRGRVEVEFIPTGYTAVLQVLDKGVHRTFKHFFRENCVNWLTQQELPNEKPTRILVARWIRDAWERVTVSSIVNTWNSLPLYPYQSE